MTPTLCVSRYHHSTTTTTAIFCSPDRLSLHVRVASQPACTSPVAIHRTTYSTLPSCLAGRLYNMYHSDVFTSISAVSAACTSSKHTVHIFRPQWHTSQIGTALCRQRMRAANPSLAPPQQHIHCSRQLSEASQDPGWAGNSSRSGVVADLPSRKRVRLSPSRDRYTSRPSTKRLQGAHQTHDSGGTSS